jgi:hypothetical protein
MPMPDISTIEAAHKLIRDTITALKAAGVDVPIALYRAAHALSYEIADRQKS